MKPVRKAVLPVAGFGTRVLPATKAVPKEMLTVFDRPALQYVVDEAGRWSMSCFACHAGQVGEQVWPGLGNAHFALQDLTDDLVASREGEALGEVINALVARETPAR